jgi:C-terminal processing protease CtpA/Prc
MPVPGTGTAVWWETQQDSSLVFGIPQVGFRDGQGHFMEKTQVEPDVRVPNDSKKVSEGEDQQLEKAVEFHYAEAAVRFQRALRNDLARLIEYEKSVGGASLPDLTAFVRLSHISIN